jgi:cell surface protein SprA
VNVKPFDKLIKIPALKLIKDFNFNYAPTSIDFRVDVDRNYTENKVRNVNTNMIGIMPTFNKDFRISRVYGMRYELTKSLKFDYAATNLATVDEPMGRLDTQEKKDSLLFNLRSLGRNTSFAQNVTATYQVPINKLPMLDWVTMSTSYNGRYEWKAASLASLQFENIISNSRSLQVNPQFNLLGLYGKSNYETSITILKTC